MPEKPPGETTYQDLIETFDEGGSSRFRESVITYSGKVGLKRLTMVELNSTGSRPNPFRREEPLQPASNTEPAATQ